jgi:hypothetical protein
MTPEEARKKQCREAYAAIVGDGIGGKKVLNWAFPNCSAEDCAHWRWSNKVDFNGYCGKSGDPYPMLRMETQ